MSDNYRLSALRLINWHNFTRETLRIEGSLFLMGDNGSGKTTVLDAIHCALTGNLGVELNAAARVRGRRDQGRDLTGIVLRLDLEHGLRRPEGAVAYAVVELTTSGGKKLCAGIGVFVASPDSQAEIWGLIASGDVDSLPLLVEESEGSRPADRAELAAGLQGDVLDIGRYRTRLGERLFGSREAFDEVSAFLAAGKAYREIVAKTSDFGALFTELLPAPDAAAFHEIRRALDAMERTRTDLSALDDELERLRALVGWTGEVDRQREAVARYGYLVARQAHEAAKAHEEVAARKERDAACALEAAHEKATEVEGRIGRLEDERDRLRATDEAALLERARELRRQLTSQQEEVARLTALHTDAQEVLADRKAALERAREDVAASAQEGGGQLEAVRAACAGDLDPRALGALGRLGDRLDALRTDPSGAAFEASPAESERREVRTAILEESTRLRGGVERLEAEASDAAEQARVHEAEAVRLSERGEVDPPLERLDDAVAALATAGIDAVPVYRLLEPAAHLGPEETGVIERALGPRRLGTLVVPVESHARARQIVMADFPGVPLAAPGKEGDVRADSVSGQLVLPDDAALVRSFVEHHLGSVQWCDEPAEGGAFLTSKGHLHAGHADERLPAGPARFVGEAARRRALAAALDASNRASRAARAREQEALAQAARDAARLGRFEAGREHLDALDLVAVANAASRRNQERAAVDGALGRLGERQTELNRARQSEVALASSTRTVEAAIRETGIEALASRLGEIDRDLSRARQVERGAREELGRRESWRDQSARGLEGASVETARTALARQAAREDLASRVPPEARADLDDYVLRVKKGRQIKRENLPALRDDALRAIAGRVERITAGDGIRHPLLWQKHAFSYDEAQNRLVDSTGRNLDEVATELQGEVDELTGVLRGKNAELLERIVLEDLVGTLRKEVFGLERTIKGINRLVSGLTFGTTRYRLEARLRPERRKVYRLLQDASVLGRGTLDELRDFFASRLDELTAVGDEQLPELLDYRRWFEFGLKVSTMNGDGVELSRERLRAGSGGEQAVPSYLLLFCLTKLLYDQTNARVRILLLDEAFYGIDAGRREELIRFCTRAEIDLVVATPDLDGVSTAVDSSTTLLIERSPNGDIFLHDYRFRKKEATLFEAPTPPPEELVIGVRNGESRRMAR